MRNFRNYAAALSGLVFLFILSTGCTGGAGGRPASEGEATGPQHIVAATEVIKFDPAGIPPADGGAVDGDCRASTIVGGALRCDLATGEAAEPCFSAGGGRAICNPNPVAGVYGLLVNPVGGLPSVPMPPPDKTVLFFVELDNGLTCVIRTGPEPVIVGGASALYDCSEPYTFLTSIETSAPTWEAALYTLDPGTGESSSGKAPVSVKRAWIP